MSLFIGIEAVGPTHCSVVASDDQGAVVYAAWRHSKPIILHSLDRSVIRTRLFDLLHDLCANLGIGLGELRDSVVCIGMAGAVFPSEMADLRQEFAQLELDIGRLICRSDTDIVLASHLKAFDGSVILCGSGGAVMASKAGRITRLGGWGPAISEIGSGYWIGRQAITAVANDVFTRRANGGLWERIEEWLREPAKKDYPDLRFVSIRWLEYLESHPALANIDRRSLFLAFVNQTSVEHHHAWRYMVGALSEPVIAAAEVGEATAKAIIAECITQLTDQYIKCCEAANHGLPVLPIVLYGDIINTTHWIKALLQSRLEERFACDLEFVGADTPYAMKPACGALLLALGGSTDDSILLPSDEIIRAVERSAETLEWRGPVS